MALKATVRAPQAPAPVDPFGLSFNELKNTPGAYQHRNGKVLVVFGRDGKLVKDDAVRSGYTRTNMVMVQANGTLRRVICDKSPDGVRQWRSLAAGSVNVTV